MTLFNLRLNPEQRDRLEQEAKRRGVSRSDITREALDRYFADSPDVPRPSGDIMDEWEEFGAEVVAAQRTVLLKALETISDAEWEQNVEPIYAVFRRKTVEKSRCFTNPVIKPQNDEAPYNPKVVATLGFAADDEHSIEVDLEQLFFEYAWSVGDEAFAEIPAVWERAKARLDAGEPEPSREAITQARAPRRGYA